MSENNTESDLDTVLQIDDENNNKDKNEKKDIAHISKNNSDSFYNFSIYSNISEIVNYINKEPGFEKLKNVVWEILLKREIFEGKLYNLKNMLKELQDVKKKNRNNNIYVNTVYGCVNINTFIINIKFEIKIFQSELDKLNKSFQLLIGQLSRFVVSNNEEFILGYYVE